jgi:hypothetical protein
MGFWIIVEAHETQRPSLSISRHASLKWPPCYSPSPAGELQPPVPPGLREVPPKVGIARAGGPFEGGPAVRSRSTSPSTWWPAPPWGASSGPSATMVPWWTPTTAIKVRRRISSTTAPCPLLGVRRGSPRRSGGESTGEHRGVPGPLPPWPWERWTGGTSLLKGGPARCMPRWPFRVFAVQTRAHLRGRRRGGCRAGGRGADGARWSSPFPSRAIPSRTPQNYEVALQLIIMSSEIEGKVGVIVVIPRRGGRWDSDDFRRSASCSRRGRPPASLPAIRRPSPQTGG